MTLDLPTFERALALVEHRKLAAHEAGHAAACLLLGIPVESISAPFRTVGDHRRALERDGGDSVAGEVKTQPIASDDAAALRRFALATIAGPLADDEPNWPPRWPLSRAPEPSDEATLVGLVKRLDLYRDGYHELTQEAHALVASPEFERLHVGLTHLLEQHGALDAMTVKRVKAVVEGERMQHKTFTATTVAADEGVFSTVISTASMDREGDIVEPSAMLAAMQKWAALDKLVPLAWAHSDEIVGHIDPTTARVEDGEVIASGAIDQGTPRGAEAWRLVKSGMLSFSFGYLVPDGGAVDLPGGRFRFKEIDVYEISVVPLGPANNATRVLSYKTLEADPAAVRAEFMTLMRTLLDAGDDPPDVRLRQKVAAVQRECAPIHIAEFPC